MARFVPIRKIAVGAVAGLVAFAARKVFHVELGSDTANHVADMAVTFVASYAVKDPRVKHVVAEITPEIAALEQEYLLAHGLTK